MADAIADRLGDGLGLLVDLLEHERLEAALLGALVVPVELDGLVLDGLPSACWKRRTFGPQRHDLAVARELHDARLAQERGGVRREEHLVAPDADHERHLVARADEKSRVVVMDDDECEVALELVERATHGLDEIAFVVALDEVRDGLGVGLGGERVPVVDEAGRELAVVLDDSVQDDRELRRLAAGERMRVRLGDRAVRRPTRVAEPGRRGRAVRAGAGFQIAERPDGANVVEPVRSRGARCPTSRSRGTPGARGPGGGAACTHAIRRIR